MGGFGHQVFTVRSDKDTHFTGEIVQHAGEKENLVMPGSLGGRSRIVGVRIISDENLAWEPNIFGSDAFEGGAPGADLDTDSFLGRHAFAVGDGLQIAATGPYYYFVSDLDIPYRDGDHPGPSGVSASPELHVWLVNRSAGAKTAGAAGEIMVEFLLVPTN